MVSGGLPIGIGHESGAGEEFVGLRRGYEAGAGRPLDNRSNRNGGRLRCHGGSRLCLVRRGWPGQDELSLQTLMNSSKLYVHIGSTPCPPQHLHTGWQARQIRTADPTSGSVVIV